jgi:hypothetical protein
MNNYSREASKVVRNTYPPPKPDHHFLQIVRDVTDAYAIRSIV